MLPHFVLAQSDVVQHFDKDALSAALIIAIVGVILLAIVLACLIASTIQRVTAIRESNRLIMELLDRGYSADEIERVAYGGGAFGNKVSRIYRNVKRKFRGQPASVFARRAAPPMK